MSDVQISVVVPCFNGATTIAETIESVLRQEGVRMELVVVDDGSTDETPRILERFRGRAMILRGPNRGVSAARERGTTEARGAFLQYLDADDLLLPGTLAMRLAAANETGADVIYCAYRDLVFEDGMWREGAVYEPRIEDGETDTELATFATFWLPPAAILYSRRIVYAIGGWRRNLPIIQDARFLQDAAAAGARFTRIDGAGAVYRRTGHGLSARGERAFALDVLLNTEEIRQRWEGAGPLSASRRAALISSTHYAAAVLLQEDAAGFERALMMLWELEPRFRVSRPKVAGLISRAVGRPIAAGLFRALDRARGVA